MQTGFTGSRMVFAHVVIIGSLNLESKAKFQQSIDIFLHKTEHSCSNQCQQITNQVTLHFPE
jgi:hypothetical protein